MQTIKLKLNRKILGVIFALAFVFCGVMVLPTVVQAIDPPDAGFQLVPTDCGVSFAGVSLNECGWPHLMILISNIIKFIIYIAVSIGVLACCYAGFLYITAFGEAGKIEQAHKIFSSVIVGMLIILLAWLIIATILKTLGVKEQWTILDTAGVTTIQKE